MTRALRAARIEPQSGDIYVMPSPDSPLQRLPLSMAQLVELSPYSISGEDSMKVFVGKKETSLLLVELETGRIKATLSSDECPWDPFEDLSKDKADDVGIWEDDDDLELALHPRLQRRRLAPPSFLSTSHARRRRPRRPRLASTRDASGLDGRTDAPWVPASCLRCAAFQLPRGPTPA